MSVYDDFLRSQSAGQAGEASATAAAVEHPRDRKRKGKGKGKGKSKGRGRGGGGGGSAEPSLTGALTPAQLRREMNAAARVEYGPRQSELNSQIRTAATRQGDITGWYADYLKAVQGSQLGTAMQYGAAENAIREPKPAATGNALDDQAALSRNALTNSFADMIKGQGLAAGANYQNQATQAPLLEAGSHIEQGRYQDKLKTSLADLLGQKGAFKIDYRSKARAGERDWLATQAASEMAGVKLDAAQANTDADNDRADAALKLRKKNANKPAKVTYTDGIDSKTYAGMTIEERRAAHKAFLKSGSPKKKSGKDRYGNTRQQRRGNNNDWQRTLGYLRSEGVDQFNNSSELLDELPNVEPDIADAALYWGKHKGKLSKPMWKYLRSLGIKLSRQRIQ